MCLMLRQLNNSSREEGSQGEVNKNQEVFQRLGEPSGAEKTAIYIPDSN